MKVKFANKIYEVLCSKEVAGKTIYAVEDEPNHIDWLVNVEIVNTEEESKDEETRKEIIDFLRRKFGSPCSPTPSKNTLVNWIAWLEKQCTKPNWCHYKVDLSNCSEEYRKAYYDGWNNCNMQYSQCKSESNDVVKCLINGMKFYYEDDTEATWGTEKFSMKVKDILAWLEKQDEQEPVSITDEWIDDYWQHHKVINPHSYNKGEEIQFDYQGFVSFCKYITRLAWTEKQGEQKITNTDFKAKDWYVSKVDGKIHNASKIKPEFKVNDWITFYGDQSFKIIKIEAETNGVLNYLLLNQNGRCSYYGKKYVDENARLWTIKDAKEGDILANDHNILILKESVYDWYTNGTPYSVKAYCGIKPNGNFEIGLDNWSFCGTLHIHPATKEQKELLFQKMKEAGYTWDSDKKELVEL